jgi:hypothetical protein
VDDQGRTALLHAAHYGRTNCVQLLLEGGADKEVKDNVGRAALMVAAQCGHTDALRQLMDSGANKEARDSLGGTALMHAASDRNDHTDCVRLLIIGGANKEAKDKAGGTALRHAAENGNTNCARLLMVAGANKEAKDKFGFTALDAAQRRGKHDVTRAIASFSEAKIDDMALMDSKRRAQFMGRACHACFKTEANMLKCGLCLKAYYCTKECQKSHWRQHKATCDRGGGEPPGSASSAADSALPHATQHDDASVNAPASGWAGACHFCAKSEVQVADRLKRCDRCRSVAYCSVECQRSDWKAHKKECAKPAKQSE